MNDWETRKANVHPGSAGALWDGKPILPMPARGIQGRPPRSETDRRRTDTVPARQVFTGAQGSAGPGLPTGSVINFAGQHAPPGWLNCDGTVVRRAAYPWLFGVIGTLYAKGGEEPNEFRLPLAAGRVIVGFGEDAEQQLWPLAETGGEKQHTLESSEVPTLASTGYDLEPGNNIGVFGYDTPGAPHNNLQPYLVLMKIIKT